MMMFQLGRLEGSQQWANYLGDIQCTAVVFNNNLLKLINHLSVIFLIKMFYTIYFDHLLPLP